MNYRNRHSRILDAMAARRLDGLLVTHLPNIRYLCGFTGSAGVLVILQSRGKQTTTFFTDGRYKQQAKEEVVGARLQISHTNAMMAAAEWLSTHGRHLTVGFEADHQTVSMRTSLGK